jgi:hypothetical protein
VTERSGPEFSRAMRRLPLLPLALAALLAGCVDFTAPLPASGRPDVLEFSYGGFGGPSVSIELAGDTVVYTSRGWDPRLPAETLKAVPSDARWRAFWEALDHAGVARWRRRYLAPDIADGLGWGLRLGAKGRVVASEGSNAYPDRLGREHRGESTAEWRAMVGAMVGLVGRSYGF